jgi:hypothetical protein
VVSILVADTQTYDIAVDAGGKTFRVKAEVDINGKVTIFRKDGKIEFVFCDSKPEDVIIIAGMLVEAARLAKAKIG